MTQSTCYAVNLNESESLQYTPARIHSTSGLKSQVSKLTFLNEK